MYKVLMKMLGGGVFVVSQLSFGSVELARDYAEGVASRWIEVEKWRIVDRWGEIEEERVVRRIQ
jgi:hypothetical protein